MATENMTWRHACLNVQSCLWLEEISCFWGNRQSGRDRGLNVQGENLLLPAPSFSGAKKGHWKTGLQARPPPPSINHPNYKDEKDKQKKKGRGGGYRWNDRRKIQTEGRKTCRQINVFFTWKALQPKTKTCVWKKGGWICIFFSPWVNLSVGDQQVWFAK